MKRREKKNDPRPAVFRDDPLPPPYPGMYCLEDQAVFSINTLAVIGAWLCEIKQGAVSVKDLQAAGALLTGVREFLETLDLPATAEQCQHLAAVHAETSKQLRRRSSAQQRDPASTLCRVRSRG